MKWMSLVGLVAVLLSLSPTHAQDNTPEQPSKTQEAEKQVLKLEQEFMDALAKGPKAAVVLFERILADEAIVTEADGKVRTKAQLLDYVKTADRGPLSLERKDLKAKVYADTAVITGHIVIKGPPDDGIRYTHVYVKRQEQWQMVAAQYTNVRRP